MISCLILDKRSATRPNASTSVIPPEATTARDLLLACLCWLSSLLLVIQHTKQQCSTTTPSWWRTLCFSIPRHTWKDCYHGVLYSSGSLTWRMAAARNWVHYASSASHCPLAPFVKAGSEWRRRIHDLQAIALLMQLAAIILYGQMQHKNISLTTKDIFWT